MKRFIFVIAVMATLTGIVYSQFRIRLFRWGRQTRIYEDCPACVDQKSLAIHADGVLPATDESQALPTGVKSPPAPKDPDKAVEPVPPVQPQDKNFGVDESKIVQNRITYNGREITMAEALDAIGVELPDDSKKFRLTVIGSDVERKTVIDAFNDLEPSLKERISAWSVPPDHWSLKDLQTGKVAFKNDGHPTIYLQGPDGKSLHRQDDFMGPADLEAIRRAVKAYDATKDQDLRKVPDKASLPSIPTPIIVIGVLLAVVLFLRRRNA